MTLSSGRGSSWGLNDYVTTTKDPPCAHNGDRLPSSGSSHSLGDTSKGLIGAVRPGGCPLLVRRGVDVEPLSRMLDLPAWPAVALGYLPP